MNYFIVVRKDNPYNDFTKGNPEFWLKYNDKKQDLRKYGQIYEQISIGDTLLCYYAQGEKGHFCAILEADEKCRCNGEDGIYLIYKEQINISRATIRTHYNEILNAYKDKYSAFTKSKIMKNCFYGTFFKTNEEQFDLICSLNSK